MGAIILGERNAPQIVYEPRVAPKQTSGVAGASRLPWAQFTRRRGVIQHWMVPPAFENPGKALSELGVEQYKQAVAEYYAAFREESVGREKRIYSRWVARKLVSNFQTEVAKFQRSYHERDSKWGQVVTPQHLYTNSRMMVDIEYVLDRWQVQPAFREAAERLLRMKLESLWGVTE